MKLKERIDKFLLELGYSQDEINYMNSSTVYLARQIAMYAHYKQYRVNGDNYFIHPFNVLSNYKKLVGINDDDLFCVDVDLLVGKYNIPYYGVQEVCLLHDVLEDSDITVNEIKEIFEEFSFKRYFDLYIKEPLLLVTHNKNEDYDIYINKMINNEIASLVKFLDMADNMNTTSLICLTDYELDRIVRYANFSKMINDKWHFLENVNEYKKEFYSES